MNDLEREAIELQERYPQLNLHGVISALKEMKDELSSIQETTS